MPAIDLHVSVARMNKTNKRIKPRNLELKKETIVHLPTDQLKDVVGGDRSTRRSQCPTLCFTLIDAR